MRSIKFMRAARPLKGRERTFHDVIAGVIVLESSNALDGRLNDVVSPILSYYTDDGRHPPAYS